MKDNITNILNLTSPFIVVVISPILKYVLNIHESKNKMGKEWKCTHRQSALWMSRFLFGCSVFFPFILYFGLTTFFMLYRNSKYFYPITIFLGLIIYISIIILLNKSNKKRRIIKSKNNNILVEKIYINVNFICSLFAYVFIFFDRTRIIGDIAICIIGVAYMAGNFIFDDDEEFKYKKAKIMLENGTEIDNAICESINIKGKWFIAKCIIDGEEVEVRFLQEKLFRINYYDKKY